MGGGAGVQASLQGCGISCLEKPLAQERNFARNYSSIYYFLTPLGETVVEIVGEGAELEEVSWLHSLCSWYFLNEFCACSNNFKSYTTRSHNRCVV